VHSAYKKGTYILRGSGPARGRYDPASVEDAKGDYDVRGILNNFWLFQVLKHICEAIYRVALNAGGS